MVLDGVIDPVRAAAGPVSVLAAVVREEVRHPPPEANNSREWYHAHRADYQQASAQFEALVGALMDRIGTFDSAILGHEPKSLTFKLVRDTRFSRDKSPYNPAFRAHIAPMGKLPIPVGYYLMIRPGSRSFLGGGLFADMFKDATRMVRDHIAAHGGEWEDILSAPSFRFTVGGTALKNVPAGYDRDHPQAQYLRCKSWYLEAGGGGSAPAGPAARQREPALPPRRSDPRGHGGAAPPGHDPVTGGTRPVPPPVSNRKARQSIRQKSPRRMDSPGPYWPGLIPAGLRLPGRRSRQPAGEPALHRPAG